MCAERAYLSPLGAENLDFSPVMPLHMSLFVSFRCLAFTSSAFPSALTGLSHNSSAVDSGKKSGGRSIDGEDGLALPVSKGAHISVVGVELASPTKDEREIGRRRVSTGEGFIFHTEVRVDSVNAVMCCFCLFAKHCVLGIVCWGALKRQHLRFRLLDNTGRTLVVK